MNEARRVRRQVVPSNQILHGKRSITPQMSMRFGTFFGQSPEFWHGLQVECDFRALRSRAEEITRDIQPATALIR